MKFFQRIQSFLVICMALCTMAFLAISCAEDIIDINGSIQGVVKDYRTGALLSNCQVSLSPSGKSALTGSDGLFEFNDLDQRSYTLSFSKAGYEEATKTVEVISGERTSVNITLKSKSAFASSSNKLDFGDLSSSMELYFFNNSDESCTFSISNIPAWASVSHTSGSVAAGGTFAMTVSVNRDNVDYGPYTQILSVAYQGKTSGTINITLQMQKVQLTAPKVTIADAAENVTQNEFTISGELTATGGAEVTSYGHCWALSENPTIDNYRTDNGATTSIGTFKSVVSGLASGTIYYVRAYATNQYGTTYSKQIVVTTQDVPCSKWDGNIAKSFAGGNDTSSNPYIIETGGQLLLMKDNNDKYYELANDIDLDNKNWLPFEFKGVLDGKGCVISNLSATRYTDGQGLFSRITSNVRISNLTIKNVHIDAGENSKIGALVGYADYTSSATINNCHILLNENSQITGNENVGGLIGDYFGKVNIEDCSVEYSGTASDIIKGNKCVGGLIGYCSSSSTSQIFIHSCMVSANIKGATRVGGLLGYCFGSSYSPNSKIIGCAFKGSLSGEECVGGIAGYFADASVISCKTDVELTINSKYAGGIIGSNEMDQYYTKILSSYSQGTIKGSSSANNLGGISGRGATCIMNYSTITSSLPNFDGIGGGDVSYCASTSPTSKGGTNMGKCKDITTFLRENYQSEYDQYWNYNNTWTWSGTIDGSPVDVLCPKLSWE